MLVDYSKQPKHVFAQTVSSLGLRLHGLRVYDLRLILFVCLFVFVDWLMFRVTIEGVLFFLTWASNSRSLVYARSLA